MQLFSSISWSHMKRRRKNTPLFSARKWDIFSPRRSWYLGMSHVAGYCWGYHAVTFFFLLSHWKSKKIEVGMHCVYGYLMLQRVVWLDLNVEKMDLYPVMTPLATYPNLLWEVTPFIVGHLWLLFILIVTIWLCPGWKFQVIYWFECKMYLFIISLLFTNCNKCNAMFVKIRLFTFRPIYYHLFQFSRPWGCYPAISTLLCREILCISSLKYLRKMI